MKKIILPATIAVVIFSIVAFIILSLHIYSPLSKKPNNQQATTLSKIEFEIEQEKFVEIVNTKDPRVALQLLKNSMENNTKILNSCHELVHVLGRAAFKKYQD